MPGFIIIRINFQNATIIEGKLKVAVRMCERFCHSFSDQWRKALAGGNLVKCGARLGCHNNSCAARRQGQDDFMLELEFRDYAVGGLEN